jgi:CheY-like chemotaxis protein
MRDPFRGLTALVVEDDWFLREDLADGFRQEGWTVLETATGAGASQLLTQTKTIDVLVADIALADSTTGWNVAQAARALHPLLSVIYASAGPSVDGRRVPDSIFLSKPVAAPELMQTCRRLLSAAR